MVVQLTIKLPEQLRRQARAIAALRGETVSDVLRSALETYVVENQDAALRQATEGHELREDDALYRLTAIAEDGPADLSTNKHGYAAD